ncbi:MAG: Type 1 glutamine amidotransferase-like domain-containing protein [Armatimonadota bacterium]
MRKIVAIGGGEIGRPGYPEETTQIDEQIIRLTGKVNPRILLIPTASGDSVTYYNAFQKQFGGPLGCRTDVLYLVKQKTSDEELREKILESDAIYVGGGNTAKMLRIWRKRGVDSILKEASEKGIVLSGLSAGAICWFRYGSSDSRKFSNPDAGLMRLSGLRMIEATACPHYDMEADRRPNLRDMMRRTPGLSIALDNCSAIEVVGDEYRVLTSKPGANVYRVYWSGGVYHEETLSKDNNYRPMSMLLRKG